MNIYWMIPSRSKRVTPPTPTENDHHSPSLQCLVAERARRSTDANPHVVLLSIRSRQEDFDVLSHEG